METLALKESLSFDAIKIIGTKSTRCNRHTNLKDDFKNKRR